jgi:uncharacterized protein (TIGR02147 family)
MVSAAVSAYLWKAMEPLNTYLDYRLYLRDYYADQKQRNPQYSHRLFAQKAKLTSSGYFSEVLAGKRNLTAATMLRFARAMRLSASDQGYFECLVAFNQAKTVEERNHHYGKLLSLRGTLIDIVGQERYEFYRCWYYAAVREMLNYLPLAGRREEEFVSLGQKLEPAISAAQAKRAVKVLLRLGFIVRDKEGMLRQAAPFISTGIRGDNAPTALDIDNFQLSMLDLARRAIDRLPRSRRDLSTLTLTLSADGLAAAHAEIAALRKRLLALAEKDSSADRVQQFGFQSFPLSKP